MNASKTPKALILIAILALVGALAVAGCGGGGSSSSSAETGTQAEETEKGGPSAAEEEAATEEEEASAEAEGTGKSEEESEEEAGAGESAMLAEGKSIFTANCASCHTLSEAGASGTVGPNLDELEPDMATVEQQVIHGGGGMPAFKGQLSSTEIKAVATYVSAVAGSE
jgi:mono/diheme cytochrome c family protein